MAPEKLNPGDAAVFDAFVAPRYLSLFGDLVLELLCAGPEGRVAHLGCRTGHLDRELLHRIPQGSLVGIDRSRPALQLARSRLDANLAGRVEYREEDNLLGVLESEAYSHVVCLHPLISKEERRMLFLEAERLLCEGGQFLCALPLRGSFQEIGDLLKEYALKHDDGPLSAAVEALVVGHPTLEIIAEELESVGLQDTDVEIRTTEIFFDSGRAFVEDPVSRLMILPDIRLALPGYAFGVPSGGAPSLNNSGGAGPLEYVRDAIDRYWSETRFGLSLNVGCASSRRY